MGYPAARRLCAHRRGVLMRRYKNTVTGAEIESECEIRGGDWREVKPAAPEPPKPETKKRGVKK